MNKIETSQNRYQDSVWNSQHYSNQQPRPEQGVLIKLLQGGDPLPWSQANETVPVSMIEEPTPAEIKQRLQENKGETHWDENQYSAGSLNKWGLIYFYLTVFGKGICTMVAPAFFLFMLISSFIDEDAALSDIITTVYIYSIYIPPLCSDLGLR
ncbi:MAG: hypothetical protein OIF55_14760 [Amphritea sp.]|nr:hypothetical protein [Amphritea sp.]